MHQGILNATLILLVSSVVAVALFQYLKIPAILAYLSVGLIVGPHGLGWIPHTEDTHFLADFGVVFLLFTVGLEFSRPQLMALKRVVLGLGGAQVLLTVVVVAGIASLLGQALESSLVVGGVLAMSSTAIVVKQLNEQSELNSRHGRLSLGILLFQDMAVVPFLILIPAVSGESDTNTYAQVGWVVFKGTIIVTTMMITGIWLLRPLFHFINRYQSSELFTLIVLVFALGAAWITQVAGLTLALGAFLAGMMLGETEYRHRFEADIRPFRDVLLGLFFITIGMMLDLHRFPAFILLILLLLAAIILFKLFSIVGLSILLGYPKEEAIRTGVILMHGGEFGFVLIAMAREYGILDEILAQILLAAIILSMVVAPVFVRFNGLMVKLLFR